LRVNGGIRIPQIRLVDESNNQIGVVDTRAALERAREIGLDLVEVAPTSDPPVCRIMDYGKWLYEQKRKQRESRKKTHHASTLKEIRLRPETDPHDIDIKIKHAREFIEKGHKVQFTLNHIVDIMADLAKVDQQGRIMGRRMSLVIAPK